MPHYYDVGTDRYQLVTSPRGGSARREPDTLHHPDTARALLAAMSDGRSATGAAGEVVFHLVEGTELAAESIRPVGVEQSNSSLVVDDRWILKVFRRVQQGTNPELEVLRHLAAQGAANVPHLAGWYEVRGEAGPDTLGVLASLVPDAVDGWEWLLQQLPERADETIGPLHRLGAVVAALHRSLAQGEVDDGFGIVPGGPRLARAIAKGIAADADRVASSLPPGHESVADALADAARRAGVIARDLDAGPAIRVHGDLHLGQTLVGADGWTVIDWEGEPSRSLAERRVHQPALRDLAGLLRSLSYAAATASRATGHWTPEGWVGAARAAVLDGYLAVADDALLPTGATATSELVDLLEIEKLVYEVGYEAANRPGWLDIPVADLLRTLGRPAP